MDETTQQQAVRSKSRKKQPKGPTKRLYSVKEAAYYLGRGVDATYEMVKAGKLPFVEDGRRILLDVRDMDDFIERNKTAFTY